MKHSYNGRYYQHVTLKMTIAEKFAYKPKPGIDVIWYPRREGQPEDEYNATFICSMHDPNPLLHRNHDDIDKELEKLNVVNENLKKDDEPALGVPMQKIETLVDHPGFDHDLDFLRKKPKGVREITIPGFDLKSINEYFEKNKHLYSRTEIKPKSTHKDKETGMKMNTFDFAEIE